MTLKTLLRLVVLKLFMENKFSITKKNRYDIVYKYHDLVLNEYQTYAGYSRIKKT